MLSAAITSTSREGSACEDLPGEAEQRHGAGAADGGDVVLVGGGVEAVVLDSRWARLGQPSEYRLEVSTVPTLSRSTSSALERLDGLIAAAPARRRRCAPRGCSPGTRRRGSARGAPRRCGRRCARRTRRRPARAGRAPRAASACARVEHREAGERRHATQRACEVPPHVGLLASLGVDGGDLASCPVRLSHRVSTSLNGPCLPGLRNTADPSPFLTRRPRRCLFRAIARRLQPKSTEGEACT